MAYPLPKSLWRVIQRGIEAARPSRVLLFGSRARGTAQPGADFDLAFEGIRDARACRDFRVDALYEPTCILPIDLVWFEDAPPELQAEIREDGVVLWHEDAPAAF